MRSAGPAGRPLLVAGAILLSVAAGCSSANEPADTSGGGATDRTPVASPSPSPSVADDRTPLLQDLPDLQAASTHPKFELATKGSHELADNRIGLSYAGSAWLDLPHLQDIADEITSFGAKHVNTSLYEVEPPIDWEAREYEIPEEYDRYVDVLTDNGVSLDYILHYWDKEGRALGETLSTPRFKDPRQVEDFVDYVRFIVRYFKGRIANYTIWSEPDNCGQEDGIKCVEPHDYIELVRQVVPVIREEDPEATVGIAPVVLFFERDFLPTVLSSDVAPMFDVIQWHGQYGVTPDDPFYAQHGYYEEYPAIVEEIREVAEAHGFRGEYWSTEMGWCSQDEEPPCANPDHPWGAVATNKRAAKYLARAVVMHLGMDIGAGITLERGPWYFPTERYLATVMAGATPIDLPVDVSGDVTSVRLQSFGFRLPGGDRMFAVWTDGAAVDDDPGIPATLTFPGQSPSRAVGFDVLHGFEQELITGTDDGDLVVRDVLVKDYPTILRLER